MFNGFGRDISLILQTHEISLHKKQFTWSPHSDHSLICSCYNIVYFQIVFDISCVQTSAHMIWCYPSPSIVCLLVKMFTTMDGPLLFSYKIKNIYCHLNFADRITPPYLNGKLNDKITVYALYTYWKSGYEKGNIAIHYYDQLITKLCDETDRCWQHLTWSLCYMDWLFTYTLILWLLVIFLTLSYATSPM